MVQIVGILNVTPDSFSDGGEYLKPQDALLRAHQLFKDGASIVDVGAESTRPGATRLTSDEEWRRLEPILVDLLVAFPGKISIDTYHPETIGRAFKIGPVIINDITGMADPNMAKTALRHMPRKVIISHLPYSGDIQKAHKEAFVSDIEEVKGTLLENAKLLIDKGLRQDQIILDPGIGFGKTMELNSQLLAFAQYVPDFEVMIGYSRKRFLGDERMKLSPNLEAGKIAVATGATYIRIHDVAGHKPLLT